MKNDVKKIGWLLLLGQLFFQSTVFLAVIAGILLGMENKAMIVGSAVGSFLANVAVFGIFYLVRKKDFVRNTDGKVSPKIILGGLGIILLWNLAISALDLLTYAGNLKNLDGCKDNPNFKFVKMDIRDRENINKLFEEEKFDIVVNFAAESHVDRMNVSIDHLLDDGESPDFGEMTEPVNLNDYEKTGKCRNKADAACLVKITKDFIKTSELTEKVSTNTFVIGSYKYRKTVFKLK